MSSDPGAPDTWAQRLRVLHHDLEAHDFVAEVTGDTLAFQAIDLAPALLSPGKEAGDQATLRVMFFLNDGDQPRVAATTFTAEHGGTVTLLRRRLTVKTSLSRVEPSLLRHLYFVACTMADHLRRARTTAPAGTPTPR